MFCPKCGTQVEEGSRFCQKCGTQVDQPAAAIQPTAVPSQSTAAQPVGFQPVAAIKNSGLAVASLVLGLIGLFFFPFLPSIIAIILGALGIGQVNRSNGTLKGKGMATAGIILGIVAIVIMIFIVATLGFSMTWISDIANDMY